MALAPATLYLQVFRGTDLSIELTFQDDDGAAVNITGYTFVAQVRSTPESGVLVANLLPTITDAAAGKLTLTMTDVTSLALTAGVYEWDLLEQNPDTLRLGPLLGGPFIVREPVSKF